jgi:hypothetical protein
MIAALGFGCGDAQAERVAGSIDESSSPSTTPSPAVATPAGTEVLLGCWDMVISAPLGNKQGKLCFATGDGGALTARLLRKDEWRSAKAVRATPGHVEIVVDAPIGEATISADYTPTSMTGKLEAKLGSRTFSAKRAAG